MKINEIITILNNVIPKKDSWPCATEEYGPYNIRDFNAEVGKLLYCVTATNEVVQYFRKNNYDLLISHHPYTKPVPMLVYHTALDCCEGGLNDMWKVALNVQNAHHFDKNLGWAGQIAPLSFDALLAAVEQFIGHQIQGFSASDGSTIKSVVICTGLGGLVFREAEATMADCYITGELTSSHRGRFKAIIETGHTLSEFMGINLFRQLLPNVQIDLAPSDIDYFGSEHSVNKFNSFSLNVYDELPKGESHKRKPIKRFSY